MQPDIHLRLLGGFELSQDDPSTDASSADASARGASSADAFSSSSDAAAAASSAALAASSAAATTSQIQLSGVAQRLVAYLALQQRPVPRHRAAGTLWPDSSEARAAASLRAALCRLPRPGGYSLVVARATTVQLGRHLDVDLRRAEAEAAGSGPLTTALFDEDLLPTWDDDWVMAERERFRQLRLHALERRCAQACDNGDFATALSAGLAAVAAEPLRESAHRRVIEVHLAENNAAEALRQYEQYRRLLRHELGLDPSAVVRGLVRHLLGRPADRPGRMITTTKAS